MTHTVLPTAPPSLTGPREFGSYLTFGFGPQSINNLVCWYQTADLLNSGALPSNGATVSTWKDKSGNGRDLTTNAGSPTFQTNFTNSKPAVHFPSGAGMVVSSSLAVYGIP